MCWIWLILAHECLLGVCLPHSMLKDITVVTWNWPWWKFLCHFNGQFIGLAKVQVFYNILRKSLNEQLVPHPWPPAQSCAFTGELVVKYSPAHHLVFRHTHCTTQTHTHTEPIVGTQQQSSSQWKTLKHRSKANRCQGQKPPGPRKWSSSVACNSNAPLTKVPNPLCHRAWAAASIRQETSLKTTTESCEDHILWPLLPMPWLCWASWRMTASPNLWIQPKVRGSLEE